MQPRLSIIIVHYLNEQFTIRCINSVIEHTKVAHLEIIVVDNSPDENFRKLLAERYPEVVYLYMGYNAGFGRANNKGLEHAQGEFVLLLNNDTIISDNAIGKALDFYKQHSWARKKGILTIRQVNEEGTLNYSAYPYFSGIGKYVKANPFIIWLNRFRAPEAERKRKKLEAFHSASRKAKWVSGAFMLFPKKLAVDHQPFFDPQFFMYSEDVELCYRLYHRGYRHFYFQEASFMHLDGGSKESSRQRMGQIYLSEWLCIQKCYGRFILWLGFKILKINFALDKYLAKNSKRAIANEREFLIYLMHVFLQGIYQVKKETLDDWSKMKI